MVIETICKTSVVKTQAIRGGPQLSSFSLMIILIVRGGEGVEK